MDTTLDKYMGIDLHSNRFNCLCFDEKGEKKKAQFDISQESFHAFYQMLDKRTHVMFEASTNAFEFYDRIKDKVGSIIIGNTFKLKLISFVDKKTDKIDAEKIAKYLKMQILGKEQLIESVYVPERGIRNLRSFFTSYRLLKKQLASIKNRIHSLLRQNMTPVKTDLSLKNMANAIKEIGMPEEIRDQIDILMDTHELISKQQEKIIRKLYIAGAAYIKTIDILTSMTGISVLTALAIIADIGDISRFPNSKKLSAYLRSAPGVDSSNESTVIKRTSKFGRKLSITLLTQGYMHFKNNHPDLNAWIARKEGQKRKGLIRMAIMRKVITQLYQMLKKGEYHYHRNEKLHTQKMREYCNFLKKNGIKNPLAA